VCNISATHQSVPVPSNSFTEVDWDWSDGRTDKAASPLESHAYTQAGTFRVTTTVTSTAFATPTTRVFATTGVIVPGA
jgi:PKD repeat protein